ncbi:MAG: hypothetical protein IK079_06230 [Desulfovibrio sp.]|nr:hypothetical protein [Desulfovibrio sp.]
MLEMLNTQRTEFRPQSSKAEIQNRPIDNSAKTERVSTTDQITLSAKAQEEFLHLKQRDDQQRPQQEESSFSEAFVAANNRYKFTNYKNNIKWTNGVYHAGYHTSQAYGVNQFPTIQQHHSTSPAQAANIYKAMAKQGVMPTSLAPLGTGISLTV